MLGHLRPYSCSLPKKTKENYQNLYCSICSSLRNQYSLPYSILLSNEMTLVLMAFEPYYEAKEGKTPCPLTAFTIKNPKSDHPAIDLAARLSTLLAWIKAVDWETDRPRFYKKYLRKNLQKKVKNTLPELLTEFKKILEEYLILTKQDSTDYEKVRAYSGLLSENIAKAIGNLTDIPEDIAPKITDLFRLSGEAISLADHLIDVEKDIQKKQYNPIAYQAKDTITLQQNYLRLLRDFNLIKYNLLQQTQELEKENQISRNFSEAFRQSLNRLGADVLKKKPAFIQVESLSPEAELVLNDCSMGMNGECECAQTTQATFGDWLVCEPGGRGCKCCDCCQKCNNCNRGCENWKNDCCCDCCKVCGCKNECCCDCCDTCDSCCNKCNCGNKEMPPPHYIDDYTPPLDSIPNDSTNADSLLEDAQQKIDSALREKDANFPKK